MVSTLAPSRRQNAASLSTASLSASSGGVRMHQRLTNNSAKPGVGTGVFGAGNGMGRHEMHVFRQMRRPCRAIIEPLTEPTSDTVAPGSEMRADFLGDSPQAPTGMQTNDEIGAFDRGSIGLHHLIGDAQFGHALARLRRTRGGDDRTHRALRAGGARNRGADQPDADQRQAIVQGRRFAHAAFPKNSASAFTTRRLASSVPTLILKAFGNL